MSGATRRINNGAWRAEDNGSGEREMGAFQDKVGGMEKQMIDHNDFGRTLREGDEQE